MPRLPHQNDERIATLDCKPIMTTQYFPHLIQRINYQPTPGSGKGIDAHFKWDYMGSAEFEFGALGKALKLMRTAKDKTWVVQTIRSIVWDQEAFYVGELDGRAMAEAILTDGLNPFSRRKLRFKESTMIEESYEIEPSNKGSRVFDGWWAIDATPEWVPFAFFKKPEHATVFLNAI